MYLFKNWSEDTLQCCVNFCCTSKWFRYIYWASQVVLVVKNLPDNAGDIRDLGSVPGSGRSPGGGHGNPLQYSCLQNPRDRGTWWATVHGVAKIQTQLKWPSSILSFLLWFITWYWRHFPMLSSRTLLFIGSVYTSLHLLIPNSLSIPPSAPCPLATTSLFSMSKGLFLFL